MLARLPSLVIFAVLMVAGLVPLGADESATRHKPQIFDARFFASHSNGGGRLVDDADIAGQQVFEVTDSAKFDFGYAPQVESGLYRLVLRAKTKTSSTAVLRVFNTSGNHGLSKLMHQEQPGVTGEDFPEVNRWYDVTRVARFYGPNYWGGLIGGWKGLRIHSFRIVRVEEPVVLLRVRPQKLLYAPGEPGAVNVQLINTTDQPQTVRFVVHRASGLDDRAKGEPKTITVPGVTKAQRLAFKDLQEVSLPLPPLGLYGNAVTVRAYAGDQLIAEDTDYCYCTRRPLQVGHYQGWSFPDDYTCSTGPDLMEQMRRTYFPIAECFFWAPCDNSMQAPDTDRWWSGQTLMRLSKKPLQEMIASGHAQGLRFVSYATRWGFGWRMWEFGRRHPDQVEWQIPFGNFMLSYSVGHMEIEERERDEEHKDLGSSGILTAAWGNPDAVASHVRQLQEGMRVMDWDGYRYDNGSPLIDEVPDIFGRLLPLPGWTHAKVVAAIRSGPREVKPDAIYGNNTGWNLDLDSQPEDDDPYTQQCRDDGLIMQEGETNGALPHKPIVREANRYFRAGYNATRFGGNQYNIIDPTLHGADHYYQVALTLAGACHICYSVKADMHPLMQLACRHCDLLYGDGLHFVLEPNGTLDVAAPPHVLWRDYVRWREISPTERVYLVHLINPPPGEKLGDSKGVFPEPIGNVGVAWTLPAGWKASRAYHITPDGGYRSVPLDFRQEGAAVRVTLPQLRCWSIMALAATGPALAPERPARPVRPPRPGDASRSLTGALTVATLQDVPEDAISQTVRYQPDAPFLLKFHACKAGGELIDDPEAMDGKARRFGKAGIDADMGHSPGITRPGRYRLTLRAKTLVTPPREASIQGFVSSANNDATPGAKLLRVDFKFSAADFPQNNKWYDLIVEVGYTWPNYWNGLSGGWDGLVLDRLGITRIGPITKKTITRTLANTWPADLQLKAHSGLRVWYGAGLYYRLYRLEETLAALGAKLDIAKVTRFRGPVFFEKPRFPAEASDLAGYDLVVLADIEARTLPPNKRQWLEAFVLRGGRLILLGGPYAFGCGGWENDPLTADILPVTLHQNDLEFIGKEKPAELTSVERPALGMKYKARPLVIWQHGVKVRPGAVVMATAGGKPAIVYGRCGKGRVAAFLLAPLGEVSPGATAFWNWPEWPRLMQGVVRMMLMEN